MSIRLAATALAVTLAFAAPAFAGEGNGDPFPGPDASVTHTVVSPKYTMGGAAPYNYFQSGTNSSTRNMSADGAPFGMDGRTLPNRSAAGSNRHG